MDRFVTKSNILLLVIALVFMMSVGGIFSANMMMDGNGMMTPCPFMGMTGICNMNPLDHIVAWQGMFTSIPAQSVPLIVLLFALSLIVVFTRVRQVHAPPREQISSYRLYRRAEYFHPVPALQELFASGILNPKLH